MKKYLIRFEGTINESTLKDLMNGKIKGIMATAMENNKCGFFVIPEQCEKCGQEINASQ